MEWMFGLIQVLWVLLVMEFGVSSPDSIKSLFISSSLCYNLH